MKMMARRYGRRARRRRRRRKLLIEGGEMDFVVGERPPTLGIIIAVGCVKVGGEAEVLAEEDVSDSLSGLAAEKEWRQEC
mmetsp:Transcript_16679/g.36057  ORF Transcript_16679/g.36057 Transcript_16679/m.36057 type:complete len:80 (-) Transcript_16679:3052-3291(-)